mgnify:CR=1 FL=1
MGAHHHNHGIPTADPGAPQDFRRRLWIAFSLTTVIVLAQAVGAFLTGSLALLTDTAHAAADDERGKDRGPVP